MIAMRGVAHGARVPAVAASTASRKGLTGETGILEAAQLASSDPNIGVLIAGDPGWSNADAGSSDLGRRRCSFGASRLIWSSRDQRCSRFNVWSGVPMLMPANVFMRRRSALYVLK